MSDQLREQLKAYKRKKNIKTPHPVKRKHKKEENLTTRELEDLMGMSRPTYGRGRGGSIRQKR